MVGIDADAESPITTCWAPPAAKRPTSFSVIGEPNPMFELIT